jgi:hypothetical protein
MHTNISASVLNFMLFLVQRMRLLLAPWRHADGHAGSDRRTVKLTRMTPGAEINSAAHAND